MLPHENEVAQDIARKYRSQLANMTALHDSVVEMLGAGEWNVTRPRGLGRTVANTMIGLLAKGSKTFRAVQLLAERGLHDEANALVRVLMEVTVAVLFILQKNSRKRALIFHAHSMGQSLKMLNEWQVTPGLKRKVTKAMLKQANDAIASYAKLLPAGTNLKHWSGKGSFQAAAKAVQGDVMYATLYRYASAISHAGDFGGQFEPDPTSDDLVWEVEPRVDGFESVTYAARQLLWACANRIDARLGLGYSAKLAPHKLTSAQVNAGKA